MASQSEIYTLALAQGLSPSAAKTAAAIAMAESGGNPRAHNGNAGTGDDSYGLWQINMLGALGPARRAQLGLSSNDQLFDPVTNAKAMRMISSTGTNFQPWSVYKSGAYQKYMGADVADDPSWLSKVGSAVTAPITGPIEAAQSLSGAVETLNKAARWVSNSENWLRVGYVAGGSVLVVVGLVMVLQSTSAGRAAMNVVPVGRVANVVKSASKGKS